jgi:hypothetical protein
VSCSKFEAAKPSAPKVAAPAASLDEAPLNAQQIGRGSPAAMEANCDLKTILAKATPTMRILIGDLDDGLKQGEIASRLNVNRFRVARMMIEMQRQFGHVA